MKLVANGVLLVGWFGVDADAVGAIVLVVVVVIVVGIAQVYWSWRLFTHLQSRTLRAPGSQSHRLRTAADC